MVFLILLTAVLTSLVTRSSDSNVAAIVMSAEDHPQRPALTTSATNVTATTEPAGTSASHSRSHSHSHSHSSAHASTGSHNTVPPTIILSDSESVPLGPGSKPLPPIHSSPVEVEADGGGRARGVTILTPTASPSPQPAAPFVEILRLLHNNETYNTFEKEENAALREEVDDLHKTVRANRRADRINLRTLDEQVFGLHTALASGRVGREAGLRGPVPLSPFNLTPEGQPMYVPTSMRYAAAGPPPVPPSFGRSHSRSRSAPILESIAEEDVSTSRLPQRPSTGRDQRRGRFLGSLRRTSR